MWHTSSYSTSGNCVAVRNWVKSSYSTSGNCLQWCPAAPDVLVRDSQLGNGSPVLKFTPSAWTAFIEEVGK